MGVTCLGRKRLGGSRRPTGVAGSLLDQNHKFYQFAKNYYSPGEHQSTAWNSLVIKQNTWIQCSEDQKEQLKLGYRATVQRTMAETIPRLIGALERMKADGDVEVRQFPPELIREIHKVRLDVPVENREKHPLTDEAHTPLQAHVERYAPWNELRVPPCRA